MKVVPNKYENPSRLWKMFSCTTTGWLLHGKLLPLMTFGLTGGQRIIFDTHATRANHLESNSWISSDFTSSKGFKPTNTQRHITSRQQKWKENLALAWLNYRALIRLGTNDDYHPPYMLPFILFVQACINPNCRSPKCISITLTFTHFSNPRHDVSSFKRSYVIVWQIAGSVLITLTTIVILATLATLTLLIQSTLWNVC